LSYKGVFNPLSMYKKDVALPLVPLPFSAPPCSLALPFRWVGFLAFPVAFRVCLRRLVGWLLSFSFLWGVLVVASSLSCRSLSPLSCVVWSRPVVVSRLGWCASSRSVLVWVSGSSAPLSCRVGRSAPAAVSALVASLRSARASGAPVSLGVRSGWSPSRWFCAVAPASARALAA